MLRITFVVLLAWATFMLSPFLALYSLSEAIATRDGARINGRINVPAVRVSLSRQIIAEYLNMLGRGHELGSFNRQLASGAGATIADPLVAQLLTTEALSDLLDDGWPETVAGTKPPAFAGLDLRDLERGWRTFIQTETRGFRNVYIPVPEDRPPEHRFRLHLRLQGTTWRLNGIELPTALRQRLAKELPQPGS